MLDAFGCPVFRAVIVYKIHHPRLRFSLHPGNATLVPFTGLTMQINVPHSGEWIPRIRSFNGVGSTECNWTTTPHRG